ncbi:MAG: AMP-binding protein [Planctomycetota bacterium]|nr:AMP-binding protein [Planctomycetota bacterium]
MSRTECVTARSIFGALTAGCLSDPERVRFRFRDETEQAESITGREILLRSLQFANGLQSISRCGDRILLPYPPGLDFVVAFLGCIAARRIPVPANYPKARRPLSRYEGIAKNCLADVAVSTASTLRNLSNADRGRLSWFGREEIEASHVGMHVDVCDARTVSEFVSQQLALFDAEANAHEHSDGQDKHCETDRTPLFLQYTSGSTSQPKGVMITAGNLLANLNTICHGFGLERLPPKDRIVCSWLPAYHDMGLVGVILSTLMHDGEAVLMSPASFLRRPGLWLESIEEAKATITVAPCFGYQWASSRIRQEDADKLDLRCLRLAACGAEPISPAVLSRFADHFKNAGFRKAAFYPCYGLAESTLMVSGDHCGLLGDSSKTSASTLAKHFERAELQNHFAVETDPGPHAAEIVHCGMPGVNTEVAIACASTGKRVAEHQIGEIVVRSASNAIGYWNDEVSTNSTFHFCFPNENEHYLRTGDLGFLHDGRLFVTGRRKELIIIAGQNFYPHDLEATIHSSDQSLANLPSVAFAVSGETTEQLVIVQEVPRGLEEAEKTQIIRRLRVAVASTHELAPTAILLVRMASIPRTSSGKVQRLETRNQYLNDDLKIVASWQYRASEDTHVFPDVHHLIEAGNAARLRPRIENALLSWVALQTGDETDFVRADQSFAEMGIDSLQSVQLAQDFEQWLGCSISPVAVWSYPTPGKMTDFLLGQVTSAHEVTDMTAFVGASEQVVADEFSELAESDLARLLDELDDLDEDHVRSLLDKDSFNV